MWYINWFGVNFFFFLLRPNLHFVFPPNVFFSVSLILQRINFIYKVWLKIWKLNYQGVSIQLPPPLTTSSPQIWNWKNGLFFSIFFRFFFDFFFWFLRFCLIFQIFFLIILIFSNFFFDFFDFFKFFVNFSDFFWFFWFFRWFFWFFGVFLIFLLFLDFLQHTV